jgi:hypothetical protein
MYSQLIDPNKSKLSKLLTKKKFSNMFINTLLVRIKSDSNKLFQTLKNTKMQIKYFGNPDKIAGLIELRNDICETQDCKFDTLYQAEKFSKKNTKKSESYLTVHNITNLINKREVTINGQKEQLIRGKIELDEKGRVLSSSVCLQDVKFWTTIFNSFGDLVNVEALEKLDKKGEFYINLWDNNDGKTQSEKKGEIVLTVVKELVQSLSPEKRKEFADSLLF